MLEKEFPGVPPVTRTWSSGKIGFPSLSVSGSLVVKERGFDSSSLLGSGLGGGDNGGGGGGGGGGRILGAREVECPAGFRELSCMG